MKLLHTIRRVKQTFGKFVTNLYQFLTLRRVVATTVLTELAVVITAQGLVPAHNLADVVRAADTDVTVPQLVLNTQSADAMITQAPRVQLTITLVESKAEEVERQKRDEAARAAAEATPAPVTAPTTDAVPTSTPVDVPLEEKRALAKAAAAEYGIDWKLVEAVWQIESGKRWQTTVRSSAGAQGPMQFMPGTWRAYAVDGNGDGVANVNDARDAVYAGARYLAANGAATDVDRALLRYNHAQWYVDKVKNLAASIDG